MSMAPPVSGGGGLDFLGGFGGLGGLGGVGDSNEPSFFTAPQEVNRVAVLHIIITVSVQRYFFCPGVVDSSEWQGPGDEWYLPSCWWSDFCRYDLH